MAIPTPDGGFNLNVNFVLAVAALFIGLINTLWDRIRLEHRITKMETIQEIFLRNMTDDVIHVAKHPDRKIKDDLIDKGIRNLTDIELEELHDLLVKDIPILKANEDLLLPGYGVSKAMVEIEQFKRAYPPQRSFLKVIWDLICGIRRYEDACKRACGGTKIDQKRDVGRDKLRDPIRDVARDSARDIIRDRVRDKIRDLDRDEIKDNTKTQI